MMTWLIKQSPKTNGEDQLDLTMRLPQEGGAHLLTLTYVSLTTSLMELCSISKEQVWHFEERTHTSFCSPTYFPYNARVAPQCKKKVASLYFSNGYISSDSLIFLTGTDTVYFTFSIRFRLEMSNKVLFEEIPQIPQTSKTVLFFQSNERQYTLVLKTNLMLIILHLLRTFLKVLLASEPKTSF